MDTLNSVGFRAAVLLSTFMWTLTLGGIQVPILGAASATPPTHHSRRSRCYLMSTAKTKIQVGDGEQKMLLGVGGDVHFAFSENANKH